MSGTAVIETGRRRVGEQGLLFDYTVKVLLLAGLLELILYRLVSRLGMHLSKVAEKYESVRITFEVLSSTGFMLLNVVSLLVFLALFLLLFNKARGEGVWRYDWFIVPATSLLTLVTLVFLIYPPVMLGAVVYNIIFFLLLVALVGEYIRTHRSWAQRVMILCFGLGMTGWLYYQTISTTYGLLSLPAVPPLAYEANRLGEAMMVLASILVFFAYGGTGFWSKNRQQRRRVTQFWMVGGTVFVGLLFVDYFATLYDEALAGDLRKAGQGIGWIFQMGMGYTFYLPFALYLTGLLCWTYTVLRLVTMGRMAGYGLGLIFIAGYALQLSHLTLMVVLGMILLNLDRRRVATPVNDGAVEPYLPTRAAPVLSEQTS